MYNLISNYLGKWQNVMHLYIFRISQKCNGVVWPDEGSVGRIISRCFCNDWNSGPIMGRKIIVILEYVQNQW